MNFHTENIVCRVVRRSHFCAALKASDGRLEGHNYILEAYVQGAIQPNSGMIIGIRELDAILNKTTLKLDHKHLNLDLEFFTNRPVTCENLALYCYNEVTKELQSLNNLELNNLKLSKVRLYETEDLWVDYGVNIQPEI